jgi:drug/metabolite transporter (DMT)-like permease
LYGTTLLASRFSVGQFGSLTYIALRLAIGTAGLGLWFAAVRRPLPRGDSIWRQGAFLGVFGTALPMIGVIGSLAYQSAGVTALLMTTAPAFTVLFAHFFLPDERMDRRKGLGVALALSGAALLAVRGETGLATVGRASPIGYALVLGGIALDSLMVVYTRRSLCHFDSFDISLVRLPVALVVVAPLALLLEGFDLSAATPVGYAVALYAALAGTLGGLLLSFAVTRRFGATAVSLTAYVIPVVAAVGGVALLGEQVTSAMVVGLGLIAAGVAVINRPAPVPVELDLPA